MIENNYLQQADVALQKGIEIKRKKCYNVHSKKCFLQCILNSSGRPVANITKELWNWTDTYVIDVLDPQDALCALMLVLTIDAEKCSRRD